MSIRLRFNGSDNFPAYNSHLVTFRRREEKEVPEEVAEYLLSDFGAFFEVVKTKSIDEPIKHRMITTESKKKTTARKGARKY